MRFNAVQRAIIDALEKIKARDIVALDVQKLTALYDLVVIATADSARQTKSLANLVREEVKKVGGHVLGSEGEESGDWVLVDCNEAIVHILQPAVRTYYHLEDLWNTTPVDIAEGMRAEPAPPSKRTAPKAPKRKALKRAAELVESSEDASASKRNSAIKKATKKAAKKAVKKADGAATKSKSVLSTPTPGKRPAAKRAAKKAAVKAPVSKRPAKKAAKKVSTKISGR